MEPIFLFVVGVGVVIAGAGLVMHTFFSDRAKAKRAIKRAQRKRIVDVRDGEVVKIVGTLRYADEVLEAPLTGRECAAWTVTVEDQGGKSRRTVIDDRAEVVSFFVEDDVGRAFIEGVATHVIVRDAHFRQGFLEAPTPRMTEFLHARGEDPKGVIFHRSLEYREGAIEAGETVAVLGIGRWEPDPDPEAMSRRGYRDRAMRLRISPPPTQPILVSDEPSVLD